MHISLAGFGTVLTAIVLPIIAAVMYQMRKWRREAVAERERHEREQSELRKESEDRLLRIVNDGNARHVTAMERMNAVTQESYGAQLDQMRTNYTDEVRDLRVRVEKQAERLDRQQEYIRELSADFKRRHDELQAECRRLSDALLKEVREKGELEKKVALLEREVEILRGG